MCPKRTKHETKTAQKKDHARAKEGILWHQMDKCNAEPDMAEVNSAWGQGYCMSWHSILFEAGSSILHFIPRWLWHLRSRVRRIWSLGVHIGCIMISKFQNWNWLKLEHLFSCSISLTSLNISISSPSFLDLTNPGVASTGGLGSVATSWLPASPPAAQTFCTTKIYGQGWVLVDS